MRCLSLQAVILSIQASGGRYLAAGGGASLLLLACLEEDANACERGSSGFTRCSAS